ncbi:MAG: endonuclease MutS2 [Dehalococcoidia bacterium]|nr:endonuclease MutS2 [Dehalococcoidia bacterium]
MNEKTLELLEFPRIREILAGFTSFAASRSLALALEPSTNPAYISSALAQSAEARRLLAYHPDFSISGAVDIREPVKMACVGKVLEPSTLLDIRSTLAVSRQVRSRLDTANTEVPLLREIARGIAELSYLEKEIGGAISEGGDVTDSASTKLAEIRLQLRHVQQQLMDRLHAIMRTPRGRRSVQDIYVTEREGRYVIPVRAEFQREIRGIVHDISNTGATVFLEPWSTVELGNDLRRLTAEEKREVERVLAALSAKTGASEREISQNVAVLAQIDLALAKARYAYKFQATEPIIPPEEEVRALRLVEARHPLLKGKAVPLAVEVGDDYSILVITGPNTGGKTVALKTIGLLTLMAQAGIPIPASELSCIPVFDGVFADIGDEQSIEQTLSTFSWHMGNIVNILRTSTARSLVLLDELGTSTDPGEGAALARAILLHFLVRGNLVVATTHFSELKVFAHTTPGLKNASLDFDAVTMAPTYHLTMGIPGGSNAMAIASQLGLPPAVIDVARQMIGAGTQEIEALLADLMMEKQRLESIRAKLEAEKANTEKTRRHWEEALTALREEEREVMLEARDRVAEETAALQKEARLAARELRKARSRENLERAEKALSGLRQQTKNLAVKLKAEQLPPQPITGRVNVGDDVWLPEIGTWGTVLLINEQENELEVQIGQTRLRTSLDGARKAESPPRKSVGAQRVIRRRVASVSPSLELDLRGKRAEEVVPLLERYLNDVSLASLGRVRIIHGVGTGTVRQIVRDALASHPLVKSFQPGEAGEGGNGVTIAFL